MADIDIFGTLNNATPDGVLARADQIKDETQNKKQSEINAEVKKQIEQLSQGGIKEIHITDSLMDATEAVLDILRKGTFNDYIQPGIYNVYCQVKDGIIFRLMGTLFVGYKTSSMGSWGFQYFYTFRSSFFSAEGSGTSFIDMYVRNYYQPGDGEGWTAWCKASLSASEVIL